MGGASCMFPYAGTSCMFSDGDILLDSLMEVRRQEACECNLLRQKLELLR